MTNKEWNGERSRLGSHGRLQSYKTLLSARQVMLDNHVKRNVELREDIKRQFMAWLDILPLYTALIENSETALSPRQLLSEPPLNTMHVGDQEWLGVVIHALFLGRTSILQQALSIKSLLGQANSAFNEIHERSSSRESPTNYFLETIKALDAAITALPNNIQVV